MSNYVEKDKLNAVLLKFSDRLRVLEAKVQSLEEENFKLKEASKVPIDVDISAVPRKEILMAVSSSNGLDAAAKKLNMEKSKLQTILATPEISQYHYYGEQWRYSAKRALGIEFNEPKVPDTVLQKTPLEWANTIRVFRFKEGERETMQVFCKQKEVASQLGTYLHKAGFKIPRKGAVSFKDWQNAAKEFIKQAGLENVEKSL
jgi:hypothetical protein